MLRDVLSNVRKAIDGLVSEGMLVRRQGCGTFVCARVEKNFCGCTRTRRLGYSGAWKPFAR